MISKSNAFPLRALTAGIGAVLALGVLTPAHAEIAGNLYVVSKYVLRGITSNAENDGAAVQGGVDYSHASGLYAGYWGSNLDYGNSTSATGFENDIYGGYKFSAGKAAINLGAIYYLYTEVDDSNAAELVASVGFGPVTFGLKYLTDDVVWGNKGDTYWTVDYSTALPKDYNFATTLGYYTYDDSDPGKPGTIATGTTTNDSGFRHLNLTLSHPLGKTVDATGKAGAASHVAITYVVGGEDRAGVKQKDAVVLSLGTTF